MTRRLPALACLLTAAMTCHAQRTIELTLWPESQGDPAAGDYEQRGDAERSNRWLTGVENPVLTAYLPEPAGERPAAAVVVFPGGGYAGQAIDKEGHYVARWLAERGVVGVVAPYRCGGGEHRSPVPLTDGLGAVRAVRSHAEAWKLDPERVGVLGFSAGGHLAATVATATGEASEAVDARPDFAVLVYPVISMREGVTHGGSRNNLLGSSPSEELVARYSADQRVTAAAPPTLLIHAVDDSAVPVENSQRFYDACRRHGVPVEMHLYEAGGHGFGMWAPHGSVAGWPAVLEGWLAARGLTPTR